MNKNEIIDEIKNIKKSKYYDATDDELKILFDKIEKELSAQKVKEVN